MKNINKYFLTLLVMLLGSLSAMADNVVTITGFDIAAGETKDMAVNLQNSDPIATLQIEFVLPAGITVNEIEGDKFTKVNRAARHGLNVTEKTVTDGKGNVCEAYQLLVTSTTLREMAAGNEAIITFEVTASSSYSPFSGITMTRVKGGNQTQTTLINETVPQTIENVKAHFVITGTESVSGKAGQVFPVTINLENKVQVTQMQAKIVLPEGLEIVPDEEGYLYAPTTRTNNLSVEGKKLDNNVYTLLISSSENQFVKGSEGAILTFNVKANKAVEGKMVIEDVVCSDKYANSIKSVETTDIPVAIDWCHLVYKVDGEVYKTVELSFGDKIIPEAAPVKAGYKFSGWSEIPETMPAKDIEVNGTFTEEKKSEDLNGDGKFNMKDVQMGYDIYMENVEGTLPDYNNDGKVNMKDVQWLYDAYMNE